MGKKADIGINISRLDMEVAGILMEYGYHTQISFSYCLLGADVAYRARYRHNKVDSHWFDVTVYKDGVAITGRFPAERNGMTQRILTLIENLYGK